MHVNCCRSSLWHPPLFSIPYVSVKDSSGLSQKTVQLQRSFQALQIERLGQAREPRRPILLAPILPWRHAALTPLPSRAEPFTEEMHTLKMSKLYITGGGREANSRMRNILVAHNPCTRIFTFWLRNGIPLESKMNYLTKVKESRKEEIQSFSITCDACTPVIFQILKVQRQLFTYILTVC